MNVQVLSRKVKLVENTHHDRGNKGKVLHVEIRGYPPAIGGSLSPGKTSISRLLGILVIKIQLVEIKPVARTLPTKELGGFRSRDSYKVSGKAKCRRFRGRAMVRNCDDNKEVAMSLPS